MVKYTSEVASKSLQWAIAIELSKTRQQSWWYYQRSVGYLKEKKKVRHTLGSEVLNSLYDYYSKLEEESVMKSGQLDEAIHEGY
jgi:hypothetical protein